MKGQSAEPAKNLDFGMVFGANPCAMWVYDLDTQQIIDVNEAAAKKYGYTREEMLRLRVTDIRTEEDIPRLFEAIARLRPGASLHTRAHHRKKDGTILDVGLHVTAFVESADFRPALVVVQDLDMGESLEQSLRERDNLYRIITEGAGELISLLDSASKYVYASPAYKVILGYEPVELFGKSAFDIINAADLPNFEKAFSQL